MTTTTTAGTGEGVAHLGVLQALVAFFVAIRVIYALFAGPSPDEAYYWLWGQHFSLSYYDHAPFHSWLLGLSDLIFGRSLFALRWMTLATLAGTAWIFADWAKRYAGTAWRDLFWAGLLILLASPTFGILSALAFHDYMLVFLVLLSAHFFLLFFTDTVIKGRGRSLHLVLAAVILGCAGLTKYNGVFLGLGVAGAILAYGPLRVLLRDWRLYLAGAIAAAMQLPVLVWNYQQGFASFRFHFVERHSGGWLSALNPMTILEFVGVSLLLISPFIAYAMARFFLSRPTTPFERNGKVLATWTFWLSTVVFFGISLTDTSWWWWNIVAYVVALPFLARHLGGWALYAHAAFGAVIGLHLLISSTVFPLLIALGGQDNFRLSLYGWEQLEDPVEAARAQYQPDFIASQGPEFGSILAFAIDDPEVRALTTRPNQLNYWWDREDMRGRNAIVVLDDSRGIGVLQPQFRAVTPIGVIPVERFGRVLNHFSMFYAEGYIPEASTNS